MTIRFRIFFFSFFLPLAANAQWRVGLFAGGDYNSYTSDAHYLTDLQTEGKPGWTFGAIAQYDWKEWNFLHSKIGVRGEVNFTFKNHNIEKKGDYFWTTYKKEICYVQIPLMITYSLGGETFRAFLNAGGYGGWRNILKWETDVRGVDLGGVFGAGAEWNFHLKIKEHRPKFTLQAEARCYVGALSSTTSERKFKTPHYNTTTALQLALLYNL